MNTDIEPTGVRREAVSPVVMLAAVGLTGAREHRLDFATAVTAHRSDLEQLSMENTQRWTDVRPSSDLAREHRKRGLWRDVTLAADLRRWARLPRTLRLMGSGG